MNYGPWGDSVPVREGLIIIVANIMQFRLFNGYQAVNLGHVISISLFLMRPFNFK